MVVMGLLVPWILLLVMIGLDIFEDRLFPPSTTTPPPEENQPEPEDRE